MLQSCLATRLAKYIHVTWVDYVWSMEVVAELWLVRRRKVENMDLSEEQPS